MLFLHAFTGCDTTSRIIGIGKKSVLHKFINQAQILNACANEFCSSQTPGPDIERWGSKAFVSQFNNKQGESLQSLPYKILCKKVTAANNFVTPERLPSTACAARFHALRSYQQIMVWMGRAEDMYPTHWACENKDNCLTPSMTGVNWSTGCSTLRCSCRKHGLYCSSACGPCQNITYCDNMDKSGTESESEEECQCLI